MARNLSRPQGIVLVALCVAVAAAYVSVAQRVLRASHLAALGDEASLKRAAALDRANGDYPYQIGSLKLLLQQDLPAAERSLQIATALNPHNARYWLRLASLELIKGDMTAERAALDRAVVTDPTTPTVAWDAANFYLASGETGRALPLLRRVLEARPWDSNQVFDLCWRVSSLDQMLRDLLPQTPPSYLSLLHYTVNKRDEKSSEQVWQAYQRLNDPVSGADAMFYVDYLLDNHAVARAHSAWDWLASKDASLRPYVNAGNLVVNGRFEEPFLNAGFDWRFVPNRNVKVSLDNTEFRSGGRSLAINFTGEPAQDVGVYELVAVQPNTDYQVSAWVKTQEIYSANAPRLQVDDAVSGAPVLASHELVGSTAWQDVGGHFRTGPATNLVRLHFVQPAATHITGFLWIDEVSISPR